MSDGSIDRPPLFSVYLYWLIIVGPALAFRARFPDKAELAVLERIREALEQAQPASSAGISKDDELRVRSFQFLTLKPEMVVFNAGEDAAGDETDWAAIAGEGVPYLTLCASLEMEVGQLPEADRAAFIEELGMGEPASARFLRTSYDLLGLQSFFTVG